MHSTSPSWPKGKGTAHLPWLGPEFGSPLCYLTPTDRLNEVPPDLISFLSLQMPSHPPGFTGPLGPFCCSLQPFSTFDGYLGTLGLECHSPGLSLSAECVAGTDLFHAYLNELFQYPCGVGCRTTPSLPQRKLRKEEAEA